MVVTVNEEAITQSMVEEQAQREAHNLVSQGRIPPQQIQSILPQIREHAIEQLIVKALLSTEAEAKGVQASEEAIAAGVARVTASLPDDITLQEALTRQGMTQEQLETMIGEDLAIEQLLQASLPEASAPAEADVSAFYEANKDKMGKPETAHARHILLSKESDNAETAAKELQKTLAAGGDFAAAAEEHSTCPSGKQGGDLGSFERGRMVPEFEQAAFTQDIDAIGEVVETQFGYHIIQVLDRSDAAEPTLDDVREQIVTQLQGQQREQSFNGYVEELRERATIVRPEK